MTTKENIWQEWTGKHVDTENPTPLFETDDDLNAQFKHYGKDDRRILKRSEEMETLVQGEGRKVINDWSTLTTHTMV